MGADSLPTYIYALLPTTIIISIIILMTLVSQLASVYTESQNTALRMNKAVVRLTDSDRRMRQYLRRKIRAQRPFGCKLSIFSYISVDTIHLIITESISTSLLILSLN